MARPWKHPKTGIYYLRRRVPRDLVDVLGTQVVKQSLRTKDPAEARIEFGIRQAALDAQWTELRKGNQTLDDRQVAALAGEVYLLVRRRLPEGVRDFSIEMAYSFLRYSCELALGEEKHPDENWPGHAQSESERAEPIVGNEVAEVLNRRGLLVCDHTRRRLMVQAVRATLQAIKQTIKECEGDWRSDPDADRFPPYVPPTSAAASVDVEDFWAKTSAGCAAGTKKRWRPILDRLVASAGTKDMVRITQKHVEAWRDETLARGNVSPRSFKRNDLAAIKSMFNLAVNLEQLTTNPASKVSVVLPRKDTTRQMRGFHDEEAAVILQGSLAQPPKRLSPHLAAARRWVPWICAYTGARVNEITQTRARDIKKVDGIWCIHITPEAGTQKSGLKRNVPLHEHLLEQGFVEFATAKAANHRLFAAQTDGPGTRAAEITGGKLATWVRSLEVDDPDVAPNHGWRHKFKTDARALMQEMYIDAIQGHAPDSESRKYGDFPARHLAVEIAKMPRLKVKTPLAGAGAVTHPPEPRRRAKQRQRLPHATA